MKRFFKRAVGAVLAACMLLTGVTAFAAEPAAAPSQNAAVSARASGNLALNKAATASDVESGTSFTANLAVDGMANTRWASNQDSTGAQQPRWLQIDFGATTTFDTVDIYWEQQNIDAYQLQVSTDASEWETVYERNSPPVSTYESVTLTAPAIGRYLRVYVTGYDYNVSWHSVSIYEVEVYDSTGEVPVEPQGNYQIYPIPQKVTDEEGTAPVTDTVTVIAEEGIDQVTRNRVDEVLTENDLTPVYSESPNEETTNLYIGVNGSGGLADSHEGIPREVFAEGENKYDMHVVKVFADGDIVILGKDSDAAYYGLATLEQMLDQSEAGTLKISTFEDYAFQKYRGAVEGYYGYPWSVEGTLSWFDFAKRYKMNIFLYGPKTDPYHLGQWDEDYPTEVTEEEAEIGIRTQDEMRQFAEKAAQCNVDFVWVAHPAMKKPIDFTNEETVDEGVERLMAKFDHMYDLGVRQFGIFVDDITPSAAASSCDMQIYMLNQVQEKLYDTYNTEGAAPEDQVKPLFFTPAWYTTITSGASTYMPRFKNVHEDIEICFTGNNVFSDISNVSASTFKNWIGRDPVMWWNYPVNDNVDSVYYTNPIDHFYSLDANPSNLKGVLSNPMNFSEASKVAFFGLADYTWNPGAFDAQENWENCFDAILPDDPEMAQALKTVYGSLNNSYEPTELTRLYGQYQSGNETAAAELKDKMYEILDAVELLETLKDSDDPVKRLIVEEAQTSINKLYDMAAAIGGAMAVVSSEDPLEQVHGYYLAQAANERLSIERNPRYQIIALEGSGEDIYYSTLYAVPSDGRMRPFVTTAMNAIADFDVSQLDTSAAEIESVAISPKEGVEVRQGESFQFAAAVAAGQENLDDVIWSVEGATGQNTVISRNGVLTLDTNELSPTVTVKAVSAYDTQVYDTVEVTVLDRIYVDPTIPTNQAFGAAVLGYSGNHGVGGEPENLFDESQDGSKWCPGDNTRYNQWVAFDLGADKTISTWQTVHAGVEDPLDISSNFSLQVLKDPGNVTEEQLHSNSYLGNASNWVTVAEFQGNTEDISNYEFEEPVTARYYRLYVADGCQPNVMYPATRIYECRLFGVDTATVARTHSLTVDANIVNGSVTTDASNYEEGAKVNVYVQPAEGYRLQEGSLCYNGTPMEGTSFLMPAEDVVITAVFEEDTGTEPIPVDKEALQNAVNDAAKLVEADYTPDTWAALEEALAAANTVLADEEATQEAVDSALSALEAAVEGLEPAAPTPADKEALQNAVNDAAKLAEEDYTPDTWAALEEALAQANAVLADEEATQEAVDSALSALEAAVIGLEPAEEPEPEPGADKSVLQMAYDYAAAQDTSKLLESLKVQYDAALANAEAILAKEDATTEEVWDAIDQLFEAVWSLSFTQGDKTLLNALIARADEMMANADKYVQADWQTLVDALAAAKDVYEDGDAMDEDIQPVAENLLNAILIQRYKAEKSILESLINQANALDLSLYTAESVQAFTAALRTANVVLADDNLTDEDQMIVDDAVESLRSAMDNLAETSAEDPKPSDGNKDDNTKPGDTDKDGGKDTTNKDPNKGPMDNNKNPATGDSGLLAIAMMAVLLASAGAFAAARRKSRI